MNQGVYADWCLPTKVAINQILIKNQLFQLLFQMQ